MLVIRLRRIGKRQHATFRFIVSEKTRSPQSTANEFLGSYDPHTNPPTVNLKRDRVEHWLKVGAQPSETVHNILVDAGLLPGPKVKVAAAKKKPVEPAAAAAPTGSAPAAEESKKEEATGISEKKEAAPAEAPPVPTEAK